MNAEAPFSFDQIEALKIFQDSAVFHPYTCICADINLVPTEVGLICPACRRIQNWAVNWTTDKERVKDMTEGFRR